MQILPEVTDVRVSSREREKDASRVPTPLDPLRRVQGGQIARRCGQQPAGRWAMDRVAMRRVVVE